MWSVANAKAHLSEIMRRARHGQPQFIGAHEPCVVVSDELYREKIANGDHDGRWLVELAGRLDLEFTLPSRHDDRDAVPFQTTE